MAATCVLPTVAQRSTLAATCKTCAESSRLAAASRTMLRHSARAAIARVPPQAMRGNLDAGKAMHLCTTAAATCPHDWARRCAREASSKAHLRRSSAVVPDSGKTSFSSLRNTANPCSRDAAGNFSLVALSEPTKDKDQVEPSSAASAAQSLRKVPRNCNGEPLSHRRTDVVAAFRRGCPNASAKKSSQSNSARVPSSPSSSAAENNPCPDGSRSHASAVAAARQLRSARGTSPEPRSPSLSSPPLHFDRRSTTDTCKAPLAARSARTQRLRGPEFAGGLPRELHTEARSAPARRPGNNCHARSSS
mmetsp:Transcript_107551/g.343070  ORF Transcript_107551/g.343070 Transcript_107551/m.343070 type:complete len:306 (+) Transcript_107551:2291-3208(+)